MQDAWIIETNCEEFWRMLQKFARYVIFFLGSQYSGCHFSPGLSNAPPSLLFNIIIQPIERLGLEFLSEERVSIIIIIITWIFHFFTRNNPFFYQIQIFFWIKTGYCQINSDDCIGKDSSKSIRLYPFFNQKRF